MIATDKDAIICDFLQYYKITKPEDYTREYQALLACGLPPESRIMRKMSGNRLTTTETLLAALLDSVNMFRYLFICSRSKHRPQAPESILEKLNGKEKEPTCQGFNTAEDFERCRAEFAQKGTKENG